MYEIGYKTMKKFLILLLSALLASTLVACSKTKQQIQSNVNETLNEKPAPVDQDQTQPSQGEHDQTQAEQEERASIRLTKAAFDAAKAELISGDYDAALNSFENVALMISANKLDGFGDIEAYKYACNYYKLKDYLCSFDYDYEVDESFCMNGYGDGTGILITFEYVLGFNNFMIFIPAPDKSCPVIPETIEWKYTYLGSNSSGTFNPQNWFTIILS